MRFKQKLAMTIAELLVTFIVIGVASGLTIGVAVNQAEQKKIEASKTVFNNEVAVAMADMHANNELVGNTQKTFTETLKKYFEIEELSKTDVPSNFAQIYLDENGKEFNANQFKNWAISSKGIRVAYTYDENCKPNHNFSQDSSSYMVINGVYNYHAKNEALGCIKGFYDVNGIKGPNQIGKDVGVFATFPYDCENPHFIPDSAGKCPPESNNKICSQTELNCQADGSLRTLDKNTCECTCKLKCPNGKELNKEKCVCGCTETESQLKERFNCKDDKCTSNNYIDWAKSKAMCGCLPKNPNAPEICKNNGGRWDDVHCTCDCNTDEIAKKIKENCGYVEPDINNFCKLKCYHKDFTQKVKKHAADANYSSEIQNDAAKYTQVSNNINESCFTCSSNLPNNDTSVTKMKCFCVAGCSYIPDQKTKNQYKLFTYQDDIHKPDACKWVCNKTELDTLVKNANDKLGGITVKDDIGNKNNDGTFTYGNPDFYVDKTKNYKLAQEKYAKASALGYAYSLLSDPEQCTNGTKEACLFKATNSVILDKGKDGIKHVAEVNVNRNKYTVRGYHSCWECGVIYNDIVTGNSNKKKFDGFLYYLNGTSDSSKNFPYLITSANSEDAPKMSYSVKDYNKCEIQFNQLSMNQRKVSIGFHGANIVPGTNTIPESQLIRATFYLTPIKSDVPNPYTNVDIPTKHTAYTFSKYNNNFTGLKTGIAIGYEAPYDPLAINLNTSDPNAIPELYNMNNCTGKCKSVFPLKYDEGNFVKIKVNWPKADNGYQFIVIDGFDKNKNVGYMLSDIYNSVFKQEYSSGFEALEKYDRNHDGIVDRDEFLRNPDYPKLMLWNQITDEISNLNDIVFDFNTNIAINTLDDADIAEMVFRVRGFYRRLIPQEVTPTLGYKYVDVVDSTNPQRIEIWESISADIYGNKTTLYYRTNTDAQGNKSTYQTSGNGNICWYLDKAMSTPASFTPSRLYYEENGRWYEVIQATMLDIIFKSNN